MLPRTPQKGNLTSTNMTLPNCQQPVDINNSATNNHPLADNNQSTNSSANQIQSSDGSINNNSSQDHIYAVHLNLPQFAPDAPEMWFAIAEADFTANRIKNDNQKYSQTLKAIPMNISKQLWDIISNPPQQDKYQTLKTAILTRFSDSRQMQLHKLLKGMTLADKRPSQLLREMRELARDALTDEVLHQLWKERLPAWVHPHLTMSENLSLNGIAEFADRLVLNTNSYPIYTVDAVNLPHPTSVSQLENQLRDIQLTLKACQKDINVLQTSQEHTQKQLYEIKQLQQQRCSNTQQQTQQYEQYEQHSYGHRPRKRSVTPNRNGYCYYHNRWGNDARQCVQPCKFSPLQSTKPKN